MHSLAKNTLIPLGIGIKMHCSNCCHFRFKKLKEESSLFPASFLHHRHYGSGSTNE